MILFTNCTSPPFVIVSVSVPLLMVAGVGRRLSLRPPNFSSMFLKNGGLHIVKVRREEALESTTSCSMASLDTNFTTSIEKVQV
jgi:hypothetical protein